MTLEPPVLILKKSNPDASPKVIISPEAPVFGDHQKEKVSISADVKKLAKQREIAREKKDWKKADELREKINKLGYIIDDTDKGFSLKKR